MPAPSWMWCLRADCECATPAASPRSARGVCCLWVKHDRSPRLRREEGGAVLVTLRFQARALGGHPSMYSFVSASRARPLLRLSCGERGLQSRGDGSNPAGASGHVRRLETCWDELLHVQCPAQTVLSKARLIRSPREPGRGSVVWSVVLYTEGLWL